MKRIISNLRNAFAIVYLILIHIFAGLFLYENALKKYLVPDSVQNLNVQDPTEKVAAPTSLPVPSIVPAENPAAEQNTEQTFGNTNSIQYPPSDSSGKLMIPVLGIKREQITDTFNDARSTGRVHNANDIMAAGGTPVVAANDGEIARFFDSERGGITIYQYSPDKRMVYYYAHLQRRADNLRVGDFVKKGTVIGYVGDTGNSGAGNYHLHFSITVLDDSKDVFKGTEINPYPLLKDGIEAQ
ncbi:MAG TPA: M23 family metallopeptidase [Pyrinomonadaceae bacterium]|nr:M23 family metallopeptidase [Pyrinomonadaceae bacterium]